MTPAQRLEEEARLRILEILAAQGAAQSLSASLLHDELVERWWIRKTKDWLILQLGWLVEMGAITIMDVGQEKIALLTNRGADHLARILALPGVKPAARPEA